MVEDASEIYSDKWILQFFACFIQSQGCRKSTIMSAKQCPVKKIQLLSPNHKREC